MEPYPYERRSIGISPPDYAAEHSASTRTITMDGPACVVARSASRARRNGHSRMGIGTAAAQQPNVPLLCLWFPRKLSHASWKRLGWTRYWPGAWAPTTLMPRPTGRLLKEARQTPEPSFWRDRRSRLN